MGDIPPTDAPTAADHEQESQLPSTSASTAISNARQDDDLGDSKPTKGPGPSPSAQPFSQQLDMASSPSSRQPGPYNMMAMAGALPQMGYRASHYRGGEARRYPPSSPPAIVPQMPQMAHYGGAQHMGMAGQGYYAQQPHMGMPYGPGQLPPAQTHPTMHADRQLMDYYSNPMLVNQLQSGYYYPPIAPYPTQPHPGHSPLVPAQTQYPSNPARHRASSNSIQQAADGPAFGPRMGAADSRPLVYAPLQAGRSAPPGPDGSDVRPSAVRGPPRKPKQNGHAIWVGNLPPQTDLMSLVEHVCKQAQGLESLFLISKSNCAFANFKDEPTCVAAQQSLHDSKFLTARLVSRLRKTAIGAQSSASSIVSSVAADTSIASDELSGSSTPQGLASPEMIPSAQLASTQVVTDVDAAAKQDRFFILKSLTAEDLELSVRNGIWATQSHNEVALGSAFKNSENVFLIFSANKSGEYFGYARMLSEINEDPAAAIEFAPKAQAVDDANLPKAITTEATEHVPRGRIIDDSARGTIFWEVEPEDGEAGWESDSDAISSKSTDESTKTWGKPFQLEWLSTARLPFYRARGLRNPWNSNREVKIARDGTEIEPSVGRRLIGLFNRVQSPAQAPGGPRSPGTMMPPGYALARPYGK